MTSVVQQIIPYALLALIIAALVAVVYLIKILRQVEQTVTEMRPKIDGTVNQLQGVAASTQKLMEEELTPTLRTARATLENVQATTLRLSETAHAAQQMAAKANALVDTGKLVTTGGVLAKFLVKQTGGVISGLAAGVGAGVRAVAGRKKAAPPANPKPLPRGKERKALPEPEEEEPPVQAAVVKRK